MGLRQVGIAILSNVPSPWLQGMLGYGKIENSPIYMSICSGTSNNKSIAVTIAWRMDLSYKLYWLGRGLHRGLNTLHHTLPDTVTSRIFPSRTARFNGRRRTDIPSHGADFELGDEEEVDATVSLPKKQSATGCELYLWEHFMKTDASEASLGLACKVVFAMCSHNCLSCSFVQTFRTISLGGSRVRVGDCVQVLHRYIPPGMASPRQACFAGRVEQFYRFTDVSVDGDMKYLLLCLINWASSTAVHPRLRMQYIPAFAPAETLKVEDVGNTHQLVAVKQLIRPLLRVRIAALNENFVVPLRKY